MRAHDLAQTYTKAGHSAIDDASFTIPDTLLLLAGAGTASYSPLKPVTSLIMLCSTASATSLTPTMPCASGLATSAVRQHTQAHTQAHTQVRDTQARITPSPGSILVLNHRVLTWRRH